MNACETLPKEYGPVATLAAVSDKAGHDYWTSFWQGQKLPRPLDVAGYGPRAWFYQEFHRLWAPYLERLGDRPWKLLEVGCARSLFLPYFARHWGCEITGLDYSDLGCRQSRALLAREGVAGVILHQDLFHPEPQQLSAFEVVFSNGLVEHFTDPGMVLGRLAAYLRTGGLMLTVVPNLTGWLGGLQRRLSPAVMATHTPLTREELMAAHQRAGLEPLTCDYLGFLHFSVVNPGTNWPPGPKNVLLKVLKLASGLAAIGRRAYPRLPLDRRTAAYLLCIATKKEK